MLESVQLDSGMQCVLARPDTQEKRPAVIWLHERYGMVQHTRDQTERLARSGFVGFARTSSIVSTATARPRPRGGPPRATGRDFRPGPGRGHRLPALAALRGPDRIGIVGVCQTGRQPLVYAAERTNLAAAVVFHGGVYPREWIADELRPKTIDAYLPHLSCPVIGLFGEADPLVPFPKSTGSASCWRPTRRATTSVSFPTPPRVAQRHRFPIATARRKPRRRGRSWSPS